MSAAPLTRTSPSGSVTVTVKEAMSLSTSLASPGATSIVVPRSCLTESAFSNQTMGWMRSPLAATLLPKDWLLMRAMVTVPLSSAEMRSQTLPANPPKGCPRSFWAMVSAPLPYSSATPRVSFV